MVFFRESAEKHEIRRKSYGSGSDSDRDSSAAAGCFSAGGPGGAFWLNILLTLLGYIPGIVHAVWIIAKR
jgi:hypothetical protein